MGPGVNFTNLAKYKAADLGIIYGFCRAWLVTFPATYLPNSHQSITQSGQRWKGLMVRRSNMWYPKQLSCYISLTYFFCCSVWFFGILSTYLYLWYFNWGPNVIIFVPCLNQLKWIFDMRRDDSASLCEWHTGEGRTKRVWDIPSCLPPLCTLLPPPVPVSALK